MTSPQSIPRVVHQTWKDENIPAVWQSAAASWKRHLQNWEFRLWTDEDNRHLVATHYSWFLDTYDSYSESIRRVDAARYFILHRFGGVYADLDYECLRCFDDVLDGKELLLGLEPDSHVLSCVHERCPEQIVGNAFIASIPEHPFLTRLIENLTEAASLPTALEATGPFLVTKILGEDSARVTLLDSSTVYPLSKTECWASDLNASSVRGKIPSHAFGVHYWDGTWWRRASELRGDLQSLGLSDLEEHWREDSFAPSILERKEKGEGRCQ